MPGHVAREAGCLQTVLEQATREHPVLRRLVRQRDTDRRVGGEAGGRCISTRGLVATAARARAAGEGERCDDGQAGSRKSDSLH